MSDKDGGIVFPLVLFKYEDKIVDFRGYIHQIAPGLTVRQWYKGKAMKSIMHQKGWESPGIIVSHAAEIADAMIAEDEEFRKREGK